MGLDYSGAQPPTAARSSAEVVGREFYAFLQSIQCTRRRLNCLSWLQRPRLGWAQNDSRVVGLNPWHWNTWAHGLPPHYALGAKEFPAVVQKLHEIGAVIRKNDRCGLTQALLRILSIRSRNWLIGRSYARAEMTFTWRITNGIYQAVSE